MKDGYIPKYVEEKLDSSYQNITFKCTVKCKDFSATGTSLKKKQAKHCAAFAMLNVLKDAGEIPENILKNVKSDEFFQPKLKDESDESSPHSSFSQAAADTISHSLVTNYVGKLQEYCQWKSINMPVYNIVRIEGPPHNSIFVMSCSIGDMSEEASANTKKVGKQLAARKLLNKLGQDKCDIFDYKKQNIDSKDAGATLKSLNVELSNMKIEEEIHVEERDKAIKCYKDFKDGASNSINHKLNIEHKVMNYHLIHHALCSRIPVLYKEKLTDAADTLGPNKIDYFKKLINEAFDLQVATILISAEKSPSKFIIGLRVPTVPVIFEIGVGTTQQSAEHQAYFKLLNLINYYML